MRSLSAPDVVALIEAHRAFSLTITPAEHAYAMPPDAVAAGDLVLVGARDDGELLGVGALREFDPGTGEGIMRLLDRINRTGTTIVMATHDDEIVDQMRKRVCELEDGRLVRIDLDLQDEFALNQPLSLFAVEFLDAVDTEIAGHGLDVLTVIESILENPGVVLARQLDLVKRELIDEMKASGVEYEQRMERLETVTWPQPNGEELWAAFSTWSQHHPWVGGDTVRPKSVVRDMFERAMTFKEYVNHYGLKGRAHVRTNR